MADRLLLSYVETEEDLIELEKIAKRAHLDIGLHDRRLHWRYSPKTHFLILDKESRKTIGYTTANFINKDLYMRGHIFIEEPYRTKRTLLDLKPLLDKTMMNEDSSKLNINVFHNCNAIALRGFIRPEAGYIIGEKVLTYEGKISHSKLSSFNKPIDGITVRLLNGEDDLTQLLAYDKIMHSVADRGVFMRQWCKNDGINDTTAIALSSSGACVGYASLRRAINLIEPAYAESEEIGLSLLSTVLLSLSENDTAQITFPGSHGAVFAFCAAQGWESCITEHRVYSRKHIELPWMKIFATNDFFVL